MPIDLTEFSDAINIALEESSYCVVATCGPDGPDVGYKGSMQVFDRDHLSYWERTRGQLEEAFGRISQRRDST